MFKIGDFSKLTQVSIRMLRHYDELNLLKPARIDESNGYRFYAAEQLSRLNRILALQDLGFSLKQIAALLDRDIPSEQLRGMLLQKQAELADHVQAEQERLTRVAARLTQIETAGDNGHDIVIKEVAAQQVVAVRDRILHYGSVSALFDRLFGYLAPLQIHGLTAVIWHDDSYQEADIDAEALVYVSGLSVNAANHTQAGIKIYDLPATKMASVIHHGAYNTLPRAYDALTRWLASSGYEIAGPNRELYLQYAMPARSDDDSYVTEIQFPIARP
jgi:DNA-binding transcriptional MerR regulator